MSRKYIPVEESFREWRKDPEYVSAYDALEDEFAVASALIKARGDADMTQEQVAPSDGNDAGGGCAAGKRQDHAFDAHAGTFRQGHPYPAADQVRAGEAGRVGDAGLSRLFD
jgi:hypothetical protein